MTPHALVILAPGFEEIEAITTIDILRRAEFRVTVAGTVDGPITASRQTRHLADVGLEQVQSEKFDVVVLPGGNEGSGNLKKDARVRSILERQHSAGGWIAAICAGPTVLIEFDLIRSNDRLTCHPAARGAVPPGQLDPGVRVLTHGRLITSIAAGSAVEFAYAIICALAGDTLVKKVDAGVFAPPGVV